MSEEQLKRGKDNSITEEMEALGDLEAYAGSIASLVPQGFQFNTDQLLIHTNNISSAISVHRKRSEKYIHYLENQIKSLRDIINDWIQFILVDFKFDNISITYLARIIVGRTMHSVLLFATKCSYIINNSLYVFANLK